MKMHIIVEDSVHQLHVIDLFDFAEVKVPNKCKEWARDGYYYEVKVRKYGEKRFKMYRIDSENIDKYQIFLRTGMSSDDYDKHKAVEYLIRKSKGLS